MKSLIASFIAPLLVLLTTGTATVVPCQQTSVDLARVTTREQLRQLLDTISPGLNISFTQSQKNPFSFIGTMTKGLIYADGLEVVITVSPKEAIGFRIYPRYKGHYINVDKVRNKTGLMRRLLQLSNTNFLFWGIDDAGDVFTGYTVTLESGFPAEVISVVLNSIKNTDSFVRQLRPFIEGSRTPKVKRAAPL